MGGLSGGHYTAYAKNRLQDKWFSFNDTSVTPVRDPKAVRTPTAYVLFYQKRAGPAVTATASEEKEVEKPAASEKPVKTKKSKKSSSSTNEKGSEGGEEKPVIV